MPDDLDLRIVALDVAMSSEGPKATTAEVLAAAEEVYAWLRGVQAPARPN